MDKIRLGIIGLSEGNGHPYSWGAIMNGYDVAAMADCPFPTIPVYLAQQDWPAARLPGVEVSHIWCQDRALSEDVAAAAKIPYVVDRMEDMIGPVDGVLLARDDPEQHAAMSLPFLKAALPVYVDKPLATNRADALTMIAAAKEEWQLFSCSALRYAPELQITEAQRSAIGEIMSIDAVTPKSWHNYAVHVIEPALMHLNEFADPLRSAILRHGDQTHATFGFAGGRTLSVRALGKSSAPLELRLHGTKGNLTLRFKDSFTAFRGALEAFVDQIKTRRSSIPREETLAVVGLIEKGMEV